MLNITSTTQGLGLRLRNTGNEYTSVRFDAARTGAASALGILEGRWNNQHNVCQIYLQSGDDTDNKDDGRISMVVSSAAGASKTALRIEPDASVRLPNDSQKLQLGNDQDLNIWHGGSNGYIDNETGSLIFRTTGSNTERLRITSNGDLIIGSGGSWSYPKALNVQGQSGSIISLYNADTTSYAADTNTSIEFKLLTGNTGNQTGACEIRAFKENGTNGNNARALSFYTGGNGGGNAERLRISSAGYVTKPYQVAWAMHGTTTQTITGGTKLAFNTQGTGFGSFSNRNHSGVDTTNHSFTVPVTGLYSITVTVFFYTDNNTSTCSLVPFKNGSAMSNGNDTIFILGASAVNANITYSGTVLLQLNANDEITIHRRPGEGGNSRVYLPHSYFAGFLVG